MPVNSWMRLAAQDPRYALPEAIAELDPMAARDCGWVEQMTPFIRAFCPRDGWVIDPFCGFGSTLVAATIAGVPAAGVEVDPRRVSLTQERRGIRSSRGTSRKRRRAMRCADCHARSIYV